MIDNINRVDFEGKKDIASIFNNLLRRQIGNRTPTVDHIASKPDILFRLISGYVFEYISRLFRFGFLFKFFFFFVNLRYENQDVALNCGMMLRECCRYEELTKLIINSDQFYKFFEYVELSTFDIASDAFLSFRVYFKLLFRPGFRLVANSFELHLRICLPNTNHYAPSFSSKTTKSFSNTTKSCCTRTTM